MSNVQREHWGSNFGFIMATAGSAVGLGNVWKFPYITGMNGGGAFVLFYLLCVASIGLPVMLAEIALGRASRVTWWGVSHILPNTAPVSPSFLQGMDWGLPPCCSAMAVLAWGV